MTDAELYNLKLDIGESRNVAAENPEVVERLTALGHKARTELGDRLLEIEGTELREIGRIE